MQERVFEDTGGADFAHVIGNDECRYRVNMLKQRGKWSLVARRVRKGAAAKMRAWPDGPAVPPV